jgi:hypothetical protein
MLALIVVLGAPFFAVDELAPWETNRHATDSPMRHVEQIAAGRHSYVVRHGGTMDGTNCRSPIGVGMMDGPAIEQVWESNRAVRLENVGRTNVVNPWLSNGRNLFRTLDEIVAAAVQPGMTDREKAFALWFQQIRYRYHWVGDNNELGDPVKVLNVYGHNTCGNDSICLDNGQVAQGRNRLLAGEAVLGPRHYDRRGAASVRVCLPRVWPGETRRPYFCI